MRAVTAHFTIAAIQAATCAYYGESPEALVGPLRHQPLAYRRQMAMMLCRRLTDHSYPVIGRSFHRDHTTVIHAERAITKRETESPQLAVEMTEIVAIAQHLSAYHRATGTRFLLLQIEAAYSVGRFAAALGADGWTVPAPVDREAILRGAWHAQVAKTVNSATVNSIQSGEI